MMSSREMIEKATPLFAVALVGCGSPQGPVKAQKNVERGIVSGTVKVREVAVPGAVVLVGDPGDPARNHVTRTDSDGGFSVSVDAGKWFVTATAVQGIAYREATFVTDTGLDVPIVLRNDEVTPARNVSEGVQDWSAVYRTPDGEPVRNSLVLLEPLLVSGVRYATYTDDGGRVETRAPQQLHRFTLESKTYYAVSQYGGASYEKTWEVDAYPLESYRAQPPKSVIEDIRSVRVPLLGSHGDLPLDDLSPFDERFAQAKVVGVGEATHGSSEFLRMRHRLIRYLVEKHNYRVIAIEAAWGGVQLLDNYLQTGVVDVQELRRLLTGVGFWIWDTYEVLELLKWIGEYNRDRPVDDRVRLVGVDFQIMKPQFDALRVLASDCLRQPNRLLEKISAYNASAKEFFGLDEKARENAARALRSARDELQELDGTCSRAQVTLMSIGLDALQKGQEFYTKGNFEVLLDRDATMAEFTVRALEGMGGKAIVWAHNDHIATKEHALGSMLRAKLASEYLAVGQLFGKGGFRAYGQELGAEESVRAHVVGAAAPPYLEAAFPDSVGSRPYIVDLKKLGDEARKFFSVPRLYRQIGHTYSRQTTRTLVELPRAFDLIVMHPVVGPSAATVGGLRPAP